HARRRPARRVGPGRVGPQRRGIPAAPRPDLPPHHGLARPAPPGADVQKKVIRAAEQSRPDVAARRQQWRAEVMPGLGAGALVFLDETAAKTNMTRSHGYAPRGQRLEGRAPYRRWQTTTFLGALRADGFIAPLVVD